ncbi:hypothetical protein CKO09_06540 [Chromatium weissei]|nr:hypothetical protein [Chromatium weissei]
MKTVSVFEKITPNPAALTAKARRELGVYYKRYAARMFQEQHRCVDCTMIARAAECVVIFLASRRMVFYKKIVS